MRHSGNAQLSRAWRITGLFAIAAIVAAVIGGRYVLDQLSVSLPNFPPETKTVWLEQNWSKEQQVFFHHADQGSATFGVPYEWFVALERPIPSLSDPGLLSDGTYLDKFGFIASAKAEDAMPIGFARGGAVIDPTSGAHWTNPETGRDMTRIGLTCAACHTGRMTYKGAAILIDGGGAMIDVNAVRKAAAVSLFLTRYMPFRFDRFADRVLGPHARPEAKDALRAKLEAVLNGVKRVRKLDASIADRSVTEGIGRLDALNRIGNQVFGLGLNTDANYAPTSAPVRYPHLWDASWFDWVQYNSSIEQPMVRNAGEALGVGAAVDLTSTPKPTLRSALNIASLYGIEAALSGGQPTQGTGFTGLRSPRWPEQFLPPIDRVRAQRGAVLYKGLCQGCHLPPVGSDAFFDAKYWSASSPHTLILPVIGYDRLGTDPAQAEDMANRKVAVPAALGLTSDEFGFALGQLVEKTVTQWYDGQTPSLDAAQRNMMNGDRPNGIRAPLAYRVRPLDGIWATAPYLHNGSVPTLYSLLQPAAERPKRFTIGNREFDPVNVGLRTNELAGGTEIDTSVRGERNTGHEFDDAPGRPGVIGRKLSEGERRDLVEYLKTL